MGVQQFTDEDEDHQKFIKKIKNCFTSNADVTRGKRRSGHGSFDNAERAMKKSAFGSPAGNLKSNLVECLGGMNEDFEHERLAGGTGSRDRSNSDEFNLPPL